MANYWIRIVLLTACVGQSLAMKHDASAASYSSSSKGSSKETAAAKTASDLAAIPASFSSSDEDSSEEKQPKTGGISTEYDVDLDDYDSEDDYGSGDSAESGEVPPDYMEYDEPLPPVPGSVVPPRFSPWCWRETSSLTCLLDLMEVQSVLRRYPGKSIITELGDPDSELIDEVCEVHNNFEGCMIEHVYDDRPYHCALSTQASLCKAANMALRPFCLPETRAELVAHEACFAVVRKDPRTQHCMHLFNHALGQIGALLHNPNKSKLCEIKKRLKPVLKCMGDQTRKLCAKEPLKNLDGMIMRLAKAEGCK